MPVYKKLECDEAGAVRLRGQMKIRTQYIMSILGILAWHCKRQQLRFGCDERFGAGQLLPSHGSWFPQEQNKVEVTDLQNSLRLAQEEAG